MPRLVFALAALLCIPAASAYYDPFICLCNLQRSYAGVPPLGFSAELQGIAWRQASDMASMNEVTHSGA